MRLPNKNAVRKLVRRAGPRNGTRVPLRLVRRGLLMEGRIISLAQVYLRRDVTAREQAVRNYDWRSSRRTWAASSGCH